MRRAGLVMTVIALLAVCGCSACAMRAHTAAGERRVAPLFVHGEGYGRSGGFAGLRCGFLVEPDGRRIIEEELAKAGIRNGADSLSVDSVEFPLTGFVGQHPGEYGTKDTAHVWSGTLTFDGYDPARRVAWEYVSAEDYSSWAVRDKEVRVYDAIAITATRAGAEQLRRGILKRNPPVTVALFYDPVWTPKGEANGPGTEDVQAKAREISGPELRAQVKEFAAWLKAQKQP
jgi:hypothetical protein